MDNTEKYETYKALLTNLKKALKAGFYYQAIFIEYAIFEDRFSSLLKYANISDKKKNGYDVDLKEKIRKVSSRKEFSTEFVRKRLSLELLNQIDDWRDKRNKKVHKLASIPYDEDEIRELAETGNQLLKVFMSKSKSVNNQHKKTIWKGNIHATED